MDFLRLIRSVSRLLLIQVSPLYPLKELHSVFSDPCLRILTCIKVLI